MELGNAAAATFLLDQNTDPFEFIERIKDIALTFDNLTDDETIAKKTGLDVEVVKQLRKENIK